MSQESKRGTIWSDDDLDVIVSDYFDMLKAELSGQSYIKSRHSAVLMGKTGRSHRSVEFKHQNISAVLDKLGMPWIPGYKPKFNFQNSIFDAIDRYLSNHEGVVDSDQQFNPSAFSTTTMFVAPPVPKRSIEEIPIRLGQLISKFDPVKRDFLNRSLGQAGEALVVELERRRLADAGRTDLARKIRWTSQEDGDGAGYDVESFNLAQPGPLLIEVKTTNGSERTPFFLTRTESYIAKERPSDWRIYRVHRFMTDPRVFVIEPPLESALNLTPETWRASF